MLAPLAAPEDLVARNITIPAEADVTTLLASASASVREAAGCPISQAVSTVTLATGDPCELDLPGRPVSTVATVVIEGAQVPQSQLVDGVYTQGWRLVGDRLLFTQVRFTPPALVTVTYTHGLPVVPDDIVDLVCGIASIAITATDGGYGMQGLMKSIRLGDYSETYQRPAGADSPSPVSVPDSVRERLRARFGTGIATVGARR